ncbi:hypothetical protein AAII07_55505 [Microvirga sp. 0TCS3.31]
MADIVLINPKFEASFWGLEYALDLLGVKANLPVAALPLLAALTPPEHRIELVDENVRPIDYDRCARADIVGVTGMSVQRFRMSEIIAEQAARLFRRGRWALGHCSGGLLRSRSGRHLRRRGRHDVAPVPGGMEERPTCPAL